MNEQVQMLGVLGGLAVLSVSAGLALRAERDRLEARLRAFLRAGATKTAPLAEVEGALTRPDTRHPVLRAVRLGVQAHQLEQAGWSISPLRFLLVQLASGLLGFMLARLIAGRFGSLGAELMVYQAAGALAGLVLPRLILWRVKARRARRIEKHFSVALDSIANGIQAGLSLPQSLAVVSRDMPPPLGTELTLVMRELAMGLGLEEALDHLAERVDLRDVEIFVAAIHIQYRTGGDLSDILHTLAQTIRERLRIRGEVRALTAQAKLSAYVVSALPLLIALAIRFINPVYFEKLLEPGTMRILLWLALFGLVGGFYAMMRIADIEV